MSSVNIYLTKNNYYISTGIAKWLRDLCLNEVFNSIFYIGRKIFVFYKFQLSTGAYGGDRRLVKVIADLEEEVNILTHHVAEAIQYRTLDRKLW